MTQSTPDIYERQGFGGDLGAPDSPGLLVVDFINGFADAAAFGGGNIDAAIAATVPLLAEARARGWPIAHARTYFADDGADANVFCLKAPTLLALTERSFGSQFVDRMRPWPGELVVSKTVPSAFFDTNLRSWLTRHRVDALIVAGCVTSGCIRASVVDAMCCGFRPFVVSDCVGDRAAGPHEANLFDMKQKYAEVLTFEELMTRLA